MSSTAASPRTRKRPEERRAELEQAARAIALEQGLAAVTLRAVAARAGVASGLVAHYAPSMDDLVAQTFAAIVGAELADIRALLADVPEPGARMSLLLDTLLDGTRDDVTLVWVQAWALGRGSDALAAEVRRQMDAWQQAIEQIVVDGAAAGVFHDVDAGEAAALAWQILAMVDGLNAHSLVRWSGVGDRRDLTRRAIAALLGG
ncbi:TetR/AcrR family transcriptional regulator [Microbacterium hominis]|uniref:TetR family transcriptional regulator C-terminal domain-containing protein n=1 Tax=Microbacterium hominis TaxID=162426 RepID=A0A7D4Q289_9MICO|nr:TetR family transcriptional regulator C-terminal domain-containing protein [Microbacterium hominis]QKJ20458.1 TetR family transcriptional regulator C-terminal domain-containing protein [Microbacterium hominis]